MMKPYPICAVICCVFALALLSFGYAEVSWYWFGAATAFMGVEANERSHETKPVFRLHWAQSSAWQFSWGVIALGRLWILWGDVPQ